MAKKVLKRFMTQYLTNEVNEKSRTLYEDALYVVSKEQYTETDDEIHLVFLVSHARVRVEFGKYCIIVNKATSTYTVHQVINSVIDQPVELGLNLFGLSVVNGKIYSYTFDCVVSDKLNVGDELNYGYKVIDINSETGNVTIVNGNNHLIEMTPYKSIIELESYGLTSVGHINLNVTSRIQPTL